MSKTGSLQQNTVPVCAHHSNQCRRWESWATGTGLPRMVGGTISRHCSGVSPRTSFLWRSLCGHNYCGLCVFPGPQAAAVAAAERGLLGR